MVAPEGTELVAELSQRELDDAVLQLVPPHFVEGEDACTPNQLRVHRRPRERAAGLLWELPPGTTAFDLHAQARGLSHRARTLVWDSWPSLTLVEYAGGEVTSKLDSHHVGGWRGVEWHAITRGDVRAPFAEGLVPLLRERRHPQFVGALLDDLYGPPRAPDLLATCHHAYEIAHEAEALAPLLRVVSERAVREGRAEITGLGAFVYHPGPPSTIGFWSRREPVDLGDWSEALTPHECAAAAGALRSVLDRIVPAIDLVIPGIACFQCTELPEYRGTNPRTGEPVFVPGDRVIGVMLQPR